MVNSEFNLPAPKNEFLSRENYIIRIGDEFFSKLNRTLVLKGASLTGKSEIAIEYGNKFNRLNVNNKVYWIKLGSQNLEKKFKKLAYVLNVKNNLSLDINTLKREFYDQFKDSNQSTLLIFDNCNNNDVKNYLPNSTDSNVYSLITTRDVLLKDVVTLTIEPFNTNESYNILQKTNKLTDLTSFRELTQLFGFTNQKIIPCILNLLIELFNSKLESDIIFIKNMKYKNYQDLKNILLGENYLFDLLLKREQKTLKLLSYSSFVSSNTIPIGFYTQILKFEKNDVDKSIEILKQLCLATIHNDIIEIDHNLSLKMFQYFQQNETEFNEILNDYLNILTQRKEAFKEEEYYQCFISIIGHFSNREQIEIKIKLSISFGKYLANVTVNYSEALNHYQNALNDYRTLRDKEETIEFIDVLDNIGLILKYFGKIRESLKYFEESLVIKMKLFTKENMLQISDGLIDIGILYNNLGDTQKSLEYYDKALQIAKKVNNGSFTLAKIYNNIGYVNYFHGNYDKAMDYYDKSLSILTKSDGSLELANTLNNVGLIYNDSGKYEYAIKKHEKALIMLRNLFKNDNYHIADTLNHIGSVYYNKGSYKNALNYHERALSAFNKMFNLAENSSTVNTCIRISNVYTKLKNYPVAFDYIKKSEDYYKKHYKEDNILKVADICLNIVTINVNQEKKFDKCLSMCQKALIIYRKIFKSDNNYRIGDVINIMGLADFYTGDFQSAKRHFDQALDIYSAIYENFQNLRIADIYEHLGLFYKHSESYSKALTFYQSSLDIKINISGVATNIFGVYDMLKKIGFVYHCLGEFNKAFECYEKALFNYGKIGFEFKYIETLNSIGDVYSHLQHYDYSLEKYEKSLAICKELYFTNIIKADTLGRIGHVYNYYSIYKTAHHYLEQSYAIYKNVLNSENDTVIAKALNDIGLVLVNIEEFTEAEKNFDKSLTIYTKFNLFKQITIVTNNKMRVEFSRSFNTYQNKYKLVKSFLNESSLRPQNLELPMKFASTCLIENATDKKRYVLKLYDTNMIDLNQIYSLIDSKNSNVINYENVFETNSNLNFITEYFKEGSLEKCIKQKIVAKKNFDEETILKWSHQMLNGMEFLHSNDIIHNNIRASNVYLTDEGCIKLGHVSFRRQFDVEFDQKKQYENDLWSIGDIVFKMKTLKLSTDIWKLKKGELLNEIKMFELSELRAFLKKILKIERNEEI